MAKKKWIQKAIKKPGALHRDLGVAPGAPIPPSKIKSRRPRVQARRLSARGSR